MSRILIVLALALTLVGPARADAPAEVGWCTGDGPRPCVASVLRNGDPLGPGWTFEASASADQVTFEAEGELDPADTWQVTLDLGTIVPRAVTGIARDVTVERSHNTVTVTGRPLGRFGVTVSDEPLVPLGSGLDLFTNVADATPSVRQDHLRIRMADRDEPGHLEVWIPYDVLRTVYGVPNPELMTSESLAPNVTDPATVSVTQDTGAMVVRVDGLPASRRVLEIRRGVIVPTRPGNFITHRITPTSSELFFTSAQARGATVTAHVARCTPTRGRQPVVIERGGRAPIIIDDLNPGTAYDCQVRGLSKAGPGPWSKAARS